MYPNKISHCLWLLLLTFLSMCVVLFPLLVMQSRQIITIDSDALLLMMSVFSVFVSYLLVKFFNRKKDAPFLLFENNGVITTNILIKALLVALMCAILMHVGNILVSKNIDDANMGWLYLLSAIIVGPIAEEMLFRGIFLRGLLQRYSPTVTILMVSIAFALIHGAPALSEYLWRITYAFFTGFVLGCIYYRKRCLLLNIITHSAVNLFSTVIIWIISVY